VVSAPGAPADRVAALREHGAEVLEAAGDVGRRLRAALDELGRRGATSLMVEGGATLTGALLDAGEADELRLFVAPLVVGGEGARPLAAGAGAASVAEATRALAMESERCGEDLLIRARLREW
jgi:diaminohydroxyphosphoribosylaminopyrimidine deaminase/5-amino-6-(5-phosphoribosylamino)uracil reductase